MAHKLDPKFTLSEASLSELEDIFLCFETAYAKDEVWIEVFKNCKQEEIHSWVMKNVAVRWMLPDIVTYKITEVATG